MSESQECVINEEVILYFLVTAHIVVVLMGMAIYTRHYAKRSHLKITVIEDDKTLNKIIKVLLQEVEQYKVVGIDAEWISEDTQRRPVALLQLCSVKGTCALIRLNKLNTINKSLKDFLEDSSVIKVGIHPEVDSKFIKCGYDVCTKNTLDLRYLYPTTGGLAVLSNDVLGLKLDKSFEIRCGNWEAPKLSASQIQYAALDVYSAVEIFKKWAGISKNWSTSPQWSDIEADIHQYLNLPFRTLGIKTKKKSNPITQKRINHYLTHADRKFYDSCYMYAPDGKLLCTIRKSKYDWYLAQKLAEEVSKEPRVIRLLFAPKRIPGKFEGLFDKEMKIDQCVVCGSKEHLLRHRIVPKEYSKLFPVHLKIHYSHDVLVMCVTCLLKHEAIQNTLREKIREMAGYKSQTPSSNIVSRIRVAHSLLTTGASMSEEKRQFLEIRLKKECNITEINDEVLTNIIAELSKEKSESEAIVDFFAKQDETLTSFRKIWRKNFIDTMAPKCLPKNWSVDYTND